jgi:hypothetical protein
MEFGDFLQYSKYKKLVRVACQSPVSLWHLGMIYKYVYGIVHDEQQSKLLLLIS